MTASRSPRAETESPDATQIGTYALPRQRYRGRILRFWAGQQDTERQRRAPHLAVAESDESGDGFGNFDGILCLRIVTGSFD